MKQIEEVYWRDRPAEINYEAMYWTAQDDITALYDRIATLKSENATLKGRTETIDWNLYVWKTDYADIEADARELAVDNEALKAIAADLRKELAEAKDKNEALKEELAEIKNIAIS